MISEKDLETMKDYAGNTALHLTITTGNDQITKLLITKNKSLVSSRSTLNELPVVSAMAMGIQNWLAIFILSLP